MDPKLQALLDKQEITELVNAYCYANDRRDLEFLRTLYHEDATDDHGGFFKGLAMDFIDQLPQIQEPMEILHHNVTTVNIALDGDYGEGEIYVIAYHRVSTEEGPIDLIIGGRYLDTYARRDGVWKFSSRAVLADWATVNSPSKVDLDHALIQGSHIGKAGQEDPSYQQFRLLTWGRR